MRKIKNGDVYNDLTVIQAYSTKTITPSKQTKWKSLVRCICGVEKEVHNYMLSQNRVKSCGNSHGKHIDHSIGDKKGRTPTYLTWLAMMQRCHYKKAANYNSYGGKGIIVCEEWYDFDNFLEDMGNRPKDKTLDRIKNSIGYQKDNCKWSTYLEQAINRSSTKLKIGEVQLIRKICKESNLKDSFICKMFQVTGATISGIRRNKTWRDI